MRIKGFACPTCDRMIPYPEKACSCGNPLVREFALEKASPAGIAVARESSRELTRAITSLLGTREYLAAMEHGASSSRIQDLISPTLVELGYVPELQHRIRDTSFRPDFILMKEECAVLVEVERGKTLDNNMDMLDLWKCHIHPDAHHMLLLVPIWYEKTHGSTGAITSTSTFAKVCRRMSPFFEPQNATNVHSLHVIGY